MDIKENIKWSEDLEKYFKNTGEICFCYSYLHKKSQALFSKFSNFLNIPCIILSSVAGTLSIGSGTIFSGSETMGSIGIGILSILISIMNTINSYFGFEKRSENHKLCHIQYGKLHRFIKIELSLPRNERVNPSDLLKIVREKYENLQEIAPLIPSKIIEKFKNKFNNYSVAKPSEANGLDEIQIYKNQIKDIIKIEQSKSDLLIDNSDESEKNIINI